MGARQQDTREDNAGSRLGEHMAGLEESLAGLVTEGLPAGESDESDEPDAVWHLQAGPGGVEDPVWELIDKQAFFGDPWGDDSPESDRSDLVKKGFASTGAISPGAAALGAQVVTIPQRHDPGMLHTLARTSAHLRAPVDAYVTNIASTGYDFVPVINLDDEEKAVASIRGALEYERRLEMEDGADDGDPGSSLAVTDSEVESLIESVRADARYERHRLAHIFSSFSPGSTFTELRRRTREDIEVSGVGYWEVLREEPRGGQDRGRPRYACHVPSPSIRLATPDKDPAEWIEYERVSALAVRPVTRTKRYKKYVQRAWARTTWYKEYGDPRVMSCLTGQYVSSEDALGADDVPATEIFQWDIYDPLSPTGSPRWIGTLLSVQGSMAADRVNLDYFRAKPPAGMLLVTGGKLTKQVRQSIETKWQAFARGEERFHGLVVVEATSPANMPSQASGKIGIEFVPLSETQQGDALFREYDKRNAEKVAITFRVPGIERGVQESSNRASAEVSVKLANDEVYRPIRKQFDSVINGQFLPAMGITLWSFQSLEPDPIDYEWAKIVNTTAEKTGILDLNEQRRAYGQALNFELPALDEDALAARMKEGESV